jgi:hypothetical protein
MIDLDRLPGRGRFCWQGLHLRHILRLVQHNRAIVNPGDHTDPRYRLYPGNIDDPIHNLLVAGSVYVLVLGDVLHPLHGLVPVGRVDLGIFDRPIAVGATDFFTLARLRFLGVDRYRQANRDGANQG